MAGCCLVKVTHPLVHGRDAEHPLCSSLSKGSWDRHVLSARLLIGGGGSRSGQGSVGEPWTLLSEARSAFGMTRAAFVKEGVRREAQGWPPGRCPGPLCAGVAGSWF